MLEYSRIFDKYYHTRDSVCIPNIAQNAKYLEDPRSEGKLLDVYVGRDHRVCFIWQRCPEIKELYELWKDYKLGDNNEKKTK